MRIRLILLLPVAALITAFLLILASSILSTLETKFVPETAPAIKLARYESSCAAIQRQVLEIARAATSCEADPSCLVSPIVCPVVMDEARELEYERLRDLLEDECGITRTASYRPSGRTPNEAEICGVSTETREANAGEPAPEVFMF